MDTFIEVMERSGNGSSASRRLRAAGTIPGVVYGKNEPTVAISLNARQFLQTAGVARRSQLFTLKGEVPGLDGRLAVVKELQKDFIKDRVLHVDFQVLRDDEHITVRIPLVFTGEAPGVKNDGGILTVVTHDLGVRCLPRAIPVEIGVDVSGLNMGESIHAREVVLPEGVVLADKEGETIVSVVAVRLVVEETAKPAEATAEGAAAAGTAAAGAAPAAGAEAPAKDAAKDAKKEGKK